MLKIIGRILLFTFPWLIFSQLKPRFVSYDFENDSNYKNELKLLKNHPNREYEGIIKSIAELSYDHKDWETAIDYSKNFWSTRQRPKIILNWVWRQLENHWRFLDFYRFPMSSKPENQYCKPTNWRPKELFF